MSTSSYKESGVDTEKGQEFVSRIKQNVASTFSKNVLGGLGGFSAAYDASFLKQYQSPVLLSGTDGVGTKLEIARLLDKHDTVGIDLVAMCVNDILVNGGKPLFFQDYIACGKLNVARMEKIVSGIVEGCKQSGASLVGGETAEHPGLMEEDEYDLAGFVVGVVEKEKIIQGDKVQPGDRVIGLPSSGPHSNGFSWIRKLLLPDGRLPFDPSQRRFIEEEVFVPTRIYVSLILSAIEHFSISGMVHITGGGFNENIPRVLPKGMGVVLKNESLPKSTVFERLQRDFNLDRNKMYETFNMGVGFILILKPSELQKATDFFKSKGEIFYELGEVTQEPEVKFTN